MLNVDKMKLCNFQKYSVRYPIIMAKRMDESFTLEGRTGKPGDYIVSYPDGNVDIYTGNDFRGLYNA